jgi:molybdenum cofactor synthesis domain-containing protein
MKGQIVSVNISVEKGTIKHPVDHIELAYSGITNDAHAGRWHRQISLLAQESIDRFGAESNSTFHPGEFAENITTTGLDLLKIKRLDHLRMGTALLEVTQIGKTCHGGGCAIYREVGRCVMPKEGIFARVLEPGTLSAGDTIEVIQRPLRAHVITLSDRVSEGVYTDHSGPAIEKRLNTFFETSHWAIKTEYCVLPDEADQLDKALADSLAMGSDLIITTGGTGIGPRDITPDVIRPRLEREIPGIIEHVRLKHADRLPSALLSRAVAGSIGQTLIFALPGSPKAVNEYLDEIFKVLDHALGMIRGWDNH